jgi:hypothetical protein
MHEVATIRDGRCSNMKLWKKLLIGTAAVLALGAGANVVATAAGSDDPVGVVDISGPCDEAEHAGDPRCTGAAGDDDDDNSGPSENSGPGNSEDDGDDEDHSGPGRGGDSDRDDDSGHGEDG